MKRDKRENNANRNYIYEKRYSLHNTDDMLEFNQNIIDLTRKSARVSVVVGNTTLVVYVYCRTRVSKVSNLCDRLGFMEF